MLAQKPPMGWNSWNTFGPNINEKVVRDTADAFITKGLKDAGYEYVVIDDCWSLRDRGTDGRIVPDPEKFPSGMKALADYIHSKGLKFGMYSCAGTRTCAGYPGSFDYEFIDAKTFAEWGVDFLKYDFCYKPSLANGPILYNRMGMALKASGREILFSACNWGSDEVEKWIRSTGAHMYRSTGDINDTFDSFKNIAMSQVDKLTYSAPGCFNDIDMLICGMHGKGNVANGGCTDIEYRTHVEDYGWMSYVKNGAMSGTSHEAKRLEAIQIRLTGEMAEYYDVYYRVHAQDVGWMNWAKNDEMSGTAGYGHHGRSDPLGQGRAVLLQPEDQLHACLRMDDV